MDPVETHTHQPDVMFDGGSLDCGGGLLLLIRRHIDPLEPGGLLEILSTDSTVEVELPAWCRMTSNELVSWTKTGTQRSYLVCKGPLSGRNGDPGGSATTPSLGRRSLLEVTIPETLPPPAPVPKIQPLSVFGIGSWPRPRWMLQAIHDRMEGRLDEVEFQATADDAVRLSIDAQVRAGVDVVTDGEQRRDSYASFVGGLLDNCQLIPLSDLTAMVDDSEKFERELRALDVPAAEVRHPVVFGKLGRSRPLAVHELEFAQTCSDQPVKVALPGPYLLTRTMWLDCLTESPYNSREELCTEDVVRVLRKNSTSFWPGARRWCNSTSRYCRRWCSGLPPEGGPSCAELWRRRWTPKRNWPSQRADKRGCGRTAHRAAGLHVCRGNWSKDETVALAGGYGPLVDTLSSLNVGTYLLEFCTPRAGDLEAVSSLPPDRRIGVGVVNPKLDTIESASEIIQRAERAIAMFGPERVLLNPDCGFATFADNPVASAQVAAAKLSAIAESRR